MTSFLIVVAAMAFFGIVHSLTAGMQLRRRLHPIFGERVVAGWYRLAYNILSGITLLPALAAVAILPADVIYAVPLPWALLMRGLQLIGLLGLAVAATAFDLFRFIGIAQALAFLEGKELPLLSEPLNTGGVYRIVRHPLYFFSLLIIWPNPTMTTTLLAFNLAATLYFFIGSRVEEQRLLAMHGEDYAKYRQEVHGGIIPLP